MKNNCWFRRVLSVVLVLVMVMTLMPRTEAATENKALEEDIAARARATEASEILITHFVHNGFYTDYPAYYAGCYIGDDYMFHVRLCESSTEVISMLNTLFGEYADVVVYEYGEYSWNELDEYVDELANELTDLGYGITNWGVDNFTGNVYIGALSEDFADVNALIAGQQTYAIGASTPTVMLEEGNYITPASDVQPGASLGNITLGAYGYYNGQKAIVTCGHGGHYVDDIFSFGNVSGYYAVRQYTDYQDGDFAIGILAGNPTMRHSFGTTEAAMVGSAYSPVSGSYIRKYGKTSGLMEGTVLRKNESAQYITGVSGQMTITVTGITKVEATSGSVAYGDSGGPCVTYTNAFCGILNGFETIPIGNNNYVTYFYFTPNSLLSAAGFTVFAQHMVSSWSTYDADWHYGYCTACSRITREGHGAYWDETTIPYCTRCGYTA